MRPAGRTAIVTGGGPGAGAGIARAFAAEGARVLVADIRPEAAAVAGETPLLAGLPGGDSPGMRAKPLAGIPPGRLVTPPEMGAAAPFPCSGAAAAIAGAILPVDSGPWP